MRDLLQRLSYHRAQQNSKPELVIKKSTNRKCKTENGELNTSCEAHDSKLASINENKMPKKKAPKQERKTKNNEQ
jgi:hypothetical protein